MEEKMQTIDLNKVCPEGIKSTALVNVHPLRSRNI